MAERVVVAGVGMVPFMATGSHASGIAERAIRNALDDAGIDVELVDQAVASHVHGDPAAGERALARAGLTGIAVSNVSNGCRVGLRGAVPRAAGAAFRRSQCALAVGFEESHRNRRRRLPNGVRRCAAQLDWLAERNGNRRRDVCARRRQGPRARGSAIRTPCIAKPAIARAGAGRADLHGRLRRSYHERRELRRGGGRPLHAALRGTPRIARRRAARGACARRAKSPVRGRGDRLDAPGHATTRRVAERAYESAGVDPADIDVAEVHDCCVGDELVSCAALGLCAQDDIERFVRSGREHVRRQGRRLAVRRTAFGGHMRPAPTGSRRSASSPGSFAAKRARARSPGARIALQHNGGPDGAIAVAILRRKD